MLEEDSNPTSHNPYKGIWQTRYHGAILGARDEFPDASLSQGHRKVALLKVSDSHTQASGHQIVNPLNAISMTSI